jgi:transcriptional regulator with XRE-family HTH domain
VTKASRVPALIEALGQEIKARRLELGLTQEDLATDIGIDRPFVSLMEVGKKQPSLSVLFRVALGLDLTLAELVGRVERRYTRQTLETDRASRSSLSG